MPAERRPRAAAFTFLTALVPISVCVFRSNLLGPPGEWLAAELSGALGHSVYVFLAGWLALAILALADTRWWRWSVRLTGWAIMVPAAAVAFEYGEQGSGGTTGAAGLLALSNEWPKYGAFAFGGVAFLGVLLVATGVVRRLAAGIVTIVRMLWNGIVGMLRSGGRLFRWERRPRQPKRIREPVVPQFHPPTSPPPVVDVVGDSPIPIHHHNTPVATTAVEARLPYELPPLTLLDEPEPFPYAEHDERLRERATQLEKTFSDFGLKVKVVGIHTGPVITQYELSLEIGLRVAKVTVLADDIALNMSVPSVRIVAPIPGRNTVGIEVPNDRRATVRIKETILAASAKVAKSKLPLFLGKDSEGRPLIYDLAEMPHLLIAGRTGTGKSVCLNAVILSLLMTRTPEQARMILIDPKMLELSEYGKIPHLMMPVVKDMKKAEAVLGWAVDKMEERYEILSRARVRNIASYNDLPRDEVLRRVNPADDEERSRVPEKMPYIVIVIDEMGDLMMQHKKEVELHIVRLAQKSRAAGIHLICATQKPTVDVITGLIKSNLPARICFQVSSRTDSMVVLDEKGADKLLGKGDMLFLQPGTSTLVRAQGAYASDEEITRVTAHLECEPEFEGELMDLRTTNRGEGGFLEVLGQRDPLYVQAIEVVIREQRGSCSLLQRALGIGYGKAARFIDFMAEDGIVGQYNGSQARQVIYTAEKWESMKNGAAA